MTGFILPGFDTNMELTLAEQNDLANCEAVIERGLKTFVDVGNALLSIRDERLYRQTHKTFEEYCQDRWGFSKDYANRLIAATGVAQNLMTSGRQIETERQARPLTSLSPHDQRKAWQEAVDTAPDGKITGQHVATIAERYKPNPAPVRYVDTEDSPFFDLDDQDVDLETSEILPEPIGRQKPKTNRAADEYVPQGFDACQTPPHALDPLIPYLDSRWVIWEPASGEGLLVEALYDGPISKVLASDILTGQNFFEYQPSEQWDCLVTNPPYTLKYKWLGRCYELGKPFALLLPVETLGAKTAQVLFRQYGIQVIFMDQRINFKMPNIGWEGSAAQFPTAWFTWNLDLPEQMVFAEIRR